MPLLLGLSAAPATAQVLSISGPASADEGDAGTRDLRYSISLSQAISSGFLVWEVCFTGTATYDTTEGATIPASADYRILNGAHLLTFAADEVKCFSQNFSKFTSSSYDTIGIRVKGDTDPESDETVVATLSINANTSSVTLGTSVVTHTIRDDDTGGGNAAPTVANAIPDQTATAGTSFSYQFPANTFSDSDNDSLTYTATQGDGSALPTWLTFTANSRTFSGTPATGDIATVTVRVTANDGNGGTVSDSFDIVVSPAPGVEVSTNTISLTEGGTLGSYTVNLESKPTADVTVTATSGDVDKVWVHGPAGSAGASAVLTFTQTTWSETQTVAVIPRDDSDADDESVTITHAVSNTGGYGNVTADSITVTVGDDETTVLTLAESGGNTYISENGSRTFRITSTAAAPSGGLAITLPTLTFSSGYSGSISGSPTALTMAANAKTVDFTVNAANNNPDRPDGTLTVVLQAGTDYTLGTMSSVALSVKDNDATSVTLAGPAGKVTEGGTKEITVTLGRGLAKDEALTVPLTFAGSAGRNTDYTLTGDTTATGVAYNNLNSGNAEVVFTGPNTGATATVATLTLTATDDNTAESTAESVTIGLGTLGPTGLSGGTSKTNNLASFNIEDAAAPPPMTPEITIAPKSSAAVTEGNNAEFTVSADPAPNSNLTINLTVADDDAGDFVASGNQGAKTVVIAKGKTSAAYPVPTTADSTDEPNGEVKVTVAASTADPVKYTVGTTDAATVTVNDNGVTTATLTGNISPVNEGDTKTFTVSLNRGLYSGEKLVVPLTFSGTATRGASADYTLSCANATGISCASMNSGTATVTFTGPSSGTTATSVTITLTTRSDGTAESGGETVNIGLGTLTATALDSTAKTDSFEQFTINDASGTPTVIFTSLPYSGNEGNAISITLEISPTRSSPTEIGIDYTDVNTDSSDYSKSPASVTIPANTGSHTFAVQTTEDMVDENNETFTISIDTVPNGVATGTPSTATVTINGDTTDTIAPQVYLIVRLSPTSSPTDADRLTWWVIFSEAVSNVDEMDFSIDGTTAKLAVAAVGDMGTRYDVTASGGDLAELDGMVTLSFADEQDIEDTSGNALTNTTPTGTNHSTWVVDNSVTTENNDEENGGDGGDLPTPDNGTDNQHNADSAVYIVTFSGNWTTDSTPGGVAAGAHFTTLIGAVHNSDVTFWRTGGEATAGVEDVAESGVTNTFESEIADAGADVRFEVKHDGNTSATAERTFEIELSRNHPLFTLLSMIGPSPDWFVGVSGLSLLDEQEEWYPSHTVDLFAYDAGTEDGEDFSLDGSATVPQGTITSLKEQGRFSDVPMARLSFSLKTDRDSLLAVYRASGGDNWTRKDNWNSDEPVSEWYGVTTDQDGRVTELRLGDNNLSGTVHEDIAELEKLEVLYLDGNPDLGGELPRGLMDLAALAMFDISASGVCPPDDEGFRAWLMSLASFTGNDSCGSVEMESDTGDPETADTGGGGGGCAVASGGGFAQSVYHLIPAVFTVMMLLLGVYLKRRQPTLLS